MGERQYGWFWYCWISEIISATFRRFEKLINSELCRKSGLPSSRNKIFVWYWPKNGTQGGLIDLSLSRYCLKWSATKLVASSKAFKRCDSSLSLLETSLCTALLLRALVIARTPLKLLFSCSTNITSSTLFTMLSVSKMVFSRYLVKLVVCLTILNKFGLLLSLSSLVHAKSTNSLGFTAL